MVKWAGRLNPSVAVLRCLLDGLSDRIAQPMEASVLFFLVFPPRIPKPTKVVLHLYCGLWPGRLQEAVN